nr:GAF and ANTAR domain-containing protein [Actinoplanes italicus]
MGHCRWLQYGAGEGPCLDALDTGQVLQIDDMAAETRWDGYRPQAVAHGVVSSLSLPLFAGEHTAAVLNLYARTGAAFAGQARRRGEEFARQCSAAPTVARRLADQADLHHQLLEAMASRSIIDQAVGILTAQQRCSADEAFDRLRTASQHRHRKLHDVAAEIVTRVSGRPADPGGFRLPRER